MLPTSVQTVRRIPWTSRDLPLVSAETQAPTLSGGSLGHPKILPWCPLTHSPPCYPEDPLDIPGSSLGVPSDTGLHTVQRIPCTSQDPPLVSRYTQVSTLSGESLGHPRILPWCPLTHRPPRSLEDPLNIPGSSLGVPSHTGLHAVRRIPWTSQDPPLVSPHTQASTLSRGSLGHPGIFPWFPSHTAPQAVQRIPWTSRDLPLVSPHIQPPILSGGSLGHPGILPWCPLTHSPPCYLEDPLDIPGSSLGVPSHTGLHTVQRIPWTSQDPPLVSPQTQASTLSRGSLGHPRILPWCPLTHSPPCCPEDPLDIPGSSLGVPSDTAPHCPEDPLYIPGSSLGVPSHTGLHAVRRIPWTSQDPPLVSPHTQASTLSKGSLGHPGIFPWFPLTYSPPCCPEDPLDILGSSLGFPSHTAPHAVRRIPWTSWDPPLVSPHTQAPCYPEDPLDIPGSSLGVPSDTGLHTVRRIPWTSQDPPLVSPHTRAPLLSRGSLGHPGILPWCPLRHRPPRCLEDPLDIPGSSLGVPSRTAPHAVQRIPWTSRDPPLVSPQAQASTLSGGSLGHPGILPWCPLRHRPPRCPEDPLDIPGSSLGVPSGTGLHAVRRIPWTSRDPPLVSPQTQASTLSGGSLGHPGILPWCPLRHRPPRCPEDPLDIPGSSLGVPSDTGLHAVRRILWTSQDPPLVSPQTQTTMNISRWKFSGAYVTTIIV